MADFKMDRNNKVVRQRATNLASLRPTTNTPNVSSTNELQSLKAYINEQRELMQRIVGDIQNDHKRLVCALDKSTIANLPSHEVELREYTRDSLTIGCHDQSQPPLWDADRHVP
jgi:RNase P subunit RPR2